VRTFRKRRADLSATAGLSCFTNPWSSTNFLCHRACHKLFRTANSLTNSCIGGRYSSSWCSTTVTTCNFPWIPATVPHPLILSPLVSVQQFVYEFNAHCSHFSSNITSNNMMTVMIMFLFQNLICSRKLWSWDTNKISLYSGKQFLSYFVNGSRPN